MCVASYMRAYIKTHQAILLRKGEELLFLRRDLLVLLLIKKKNE